MSRVCVKGIRKNTTEKELREAFSARGEVTDVRVMRSKDGKSRQFAFVGFRTEEEATAAQSYFHGTFIDSAKVLVESARKVGDAALEKSDKARSKHTTITPAQKEAAAAAAAAVIAQAKAAKEKKEKKNGPKEPMSKEKADFMEAAKPRSQAQTWTNDAAVDAEKEKEKVIPDKKGRNMGRDSDSDSDSSDDDVDNSSDDEDVNDFTNTKKTVIKASDNARGGKSSQVTSTASRIASDDMDYLKSKVTTFSDDEDNSDLDDDAGKERGSAPKALVGVGDDDDNSEESDEEEKEEKEEKPNATSTENNDGTDALENDTDTGRLFVRNLPYSCQEEEVRVLFDSFGQIDTVHLPLDKEKGGGKGYGFIQFLLPENAVAAQKAIDGSAFQGRVLHVIMAQRSRDESAGANLVDRTGKPLSEYQLKKELERRASAGKTDGWNASFVRSEAVMESIAQRHGVEVSDIMDTAEAGGEMAVRMAVGEAKIIQENRDYFLSHGVDIAALESQESSVRASQRSGTTMLVKNLPKDAESKDLEPLFAHFGAISAFLLPPSRTVALVDFVESTEARAAFRGLAYRRYRHTPLYLEWAPLGVIDNKLKQKNAKNKSAEKEAVLKAIRADGGKDTDASAGGEEEDVAAYQTIYLKNISFAVTETNMSEHLESLDCGRARGLRTVSLPVKTDGNGRTLSMGFGFAEYSSPTAAQSAIARLNGSVLDGHKLEVKPSDKRLSKDTKAGKTAKADSTNVKLVVRNVAFQATQAEIKTLFATFGNVKRVRIPKKLLGDHRGFAFVDFSTHQEAAAAMTSLTGTHFYGRRLVLEWAKEETETIGQLRQRAGVDTAAISHEKKKQKIDEDRMGAGAGGEDYS